MVIWFAAFLLLLILKGDDRRCPSAVPTALRAQLYAVGIVRPLSPIPQGTYCVLCTQ